MANVPFLLVFLAALGVSSFITWKIRPVAVRFGFIDLPDTIRRLHSEPTPRIGGVAIFIAVLCSVAVCAFLGARGLLPERRHFALAIGATAIFALGLVDDRFGLQPRTKLLAESIVALFVFAAGIRISGIALPNGFFVLPTWASALITTLWLVGITNAFNLIDGSDGVAGGAALFASIALAMVLIASGNSYGAMIALSLAGATLGFLFFNFPPATIFLGDSGALFLGFTLASLGVVTTQTAPTALAVAIPVLSFGLPILDTVLTLIRRFLRGQGLFNADRGHIHHRLRELGHSPRSVALVLYALCACLSALSLLLVGSTESMGAVALVIAGVVAWIVVQRLHIPELLELGTIFGKGLRQRSVIANNIKVREVALRLERVRSPEDLKTCLQEIMDAGQFVRAQVSATGKSFFPKDTQGNPSRLDDWVVECGLESDADLVNCWEIRIPLATPFASGGAFLSLWKAFGTDPIMLDLRLLFTAVRPPLESALRSMHIQTPEKVPARFSILGGR